MKNLKKSQDIFIVQVIIAVFLALGISSALYYESQRKKYQSSIEQLKNTQALADIKFEKVAEAFTNRNAYIKTLAKNQKFKNMDSALQNLTDVLTAKPINIDRIEAASSELNRKVAAEVESFNKTKKSGLFKNITEIRHLEQYDRYIDLARKDYSDWTFEYTTKVQNLHKSHFFKPDVKEVSHFKVDHLIRQAALNKE